MIHFITAQPAYDFPHDVGQLLVDLRFIECYSDRTEVAVKLNEKLSLVILDILRITIQARSQPATELQRRLFEKRQNRVGRHVGDILLIPLHNHLDKIHLLAIDGEPRDVTPLPHP